MIPATIPLESDQIQARLAYELASGLKPPQDVFTQFGISGPEAKAILANPQFRQLYAEAKAIWHSSDGTRARIEAKAAMLVEDSLLEMYRLVHDVEVAPPAKIDAFKQIVSVARVGPQKDGGPAAGGPAFSLTLNLGGVESKTVTIDTPAEEVESD